MSEGFSRSGDPPTQPVSNRTVDVATNAFTTLVRRLRPSVIVHFAAQTHVTRSENDADGVRLRERRWDSGVLKAAEDAGTDLVLHVSTDEIYGPCVGPVSGGRSGRRTRSCNERVREEQGASRRDRSPVLSQDSRHRRSAVQLLRAVAAPREGDRALDGSGPPEAANSRLGDGNQVRDWMHAEDATSDSSFSSSTAARDGL